ncbi:MAG: sigma 54-interacting transcriptional regulator [Kofleriaceae bacterium]|nr:sigma 54-interacting transcriptional regulator [Kofleriaceae bacterium]
MDGKNQSTLPHGASAQPEIAEVRSIAIEVESGPAKGTIQVTAGSRCTIGSHSRCDLIVDDATVSRFHCEILTDRTRARVIDTGSRNGTMLDGVSVRDAYLRDGSRIQVGSTTLRVSFANSSTTLKLSKHRKFGEMIGESVAMREVFYLLERAANSDATLLIEGETGTGKSLAARSVHDASRRKDHPFVILDCGAIPANLMESELFGHERGAFTGASQARMGALEEADGGTLFLDEVGELPLDLQPKLLGALEGRAVLRVGGNSSRAVDVRIVAATNRNLREEVNAERFRSDLYYRFAVIAITLPALRHRRLDNISLAQQILHRLGADSEKIDLLMSNGLQQKLNTAIWSGNVRELRNYLERCLVFEEVVPILEVNAGNETGDYSAYSYAEAKTLALRSFESNYLRSLLSNHDKVASAAKHAEIDRTYFYRLLRRHGIKS